MISFEFSVKVLLAVLESKLFKLLFSLFPFFPEHEVKKAIKTTKSVFIPLHKKLWCQSYADLHASPRGGDWGRSGYLRNDLILFKIELEIYAVINHIINRRG